MSEELENSLQQAIESYLGDRLRAIDEHISRLQAEFNEALTRLRESAGSEPLAGTPVAESIAAHLQAARAQKLAEGAVQRSENSEVAAVKRATAAIEKQQSQGDILAALLSGASQFAERVALFVIKNDQVLGWRECEAGDPTNLESIRSITLPLSADTLLSCAARSGSPWSGTPGSNSEDDLLISQLGGEPQVVAAVPLVVRGKVLAMLYADAASNDPKAMNVDALELLARVAGMAVGLTAGARPASEAQVSQPETMPQPPVVEPEPVAEPERLAESEPVAKAEQTYEVEPHYEPEVEPHYEPQVEPQPPEVVAEAEVEPAPASEVEVIAEPAAEVASKSEEEVAEPEVEVAASPEPEPEVVAAEVATEEVVEEKDERVPEPVSESPMTEPAPMPSVVSPAPASTAQYSAPLGQSRRSRVAEPELPIEVSEEERRLHYDARRFARLLVSEIKLYNEKKVKEGRNMSDIYDRLRDDIDRSRQMYDRRVAPPVAARHDYFHQELVNTLAEGDSAKLGSQYPGANVAA